MSMLGRQPARAAMTAGDIGDNTIGSNKIINASIVAADIGALDASVMSGVMPVGVTGGSGLTDVSPANLATSAADITAPALYSTTIVGPVTIPNLTINGNLTVMTELNVTGNTTIAATGQLNIIG